MLEDFLHKAGKAEDASKHTGKRLEKLQMQANTLGKGWKSCMGKPTHWEKAGKAADASKYTGKSTTQGPQAKQLPSSTTMTWCPQAPQVAALKLLNR